MPLELGESPPSLTHSGSLRTQLASVRERKAKHLNYFLPLGLNSFEFYVLILKMEIMLLSPPGWYVLNEVTWHAVSGPLEGRA